VGLYPAQAVIMSPVAAGWQSRPRRPDPIAASLFTWHDRRFRAVRPGRGSVASMATAMQTPDGA
jgi:hypothetical protein